jgi:multiple sugar transport system substrate-binding protein
MAIYGGLETLDTAQPIVFNEFMEKTGITVTFEKMISTAIYEKMNTELVARTGAYDGVIIEAAYTNEWARYLWSMKELAKKFEPGGLASFEKYLDVFSKSMARCSSDADGNLMGMPYWNYNQQMGYRKDVFEHPTEKANFKKKYGYDLAPANTRQQLYDQAEFFTRGAGELLKGEALTDNIYGVALMAGNTEINDEFSPLIWSEGGRWARAIRDGNGNIKEFVITKKDRQIQKEAMEYYISLLNNFASPGCKTAFWDFTTAQFIEGKAMIIPYLYLPLFPWASSVETQVPGAKIGLAPCQGGQGYVGLFHMGIPKVSKNPEATYWLLKYLSSYKSQTTIHEGGLTVVREDVMKNPKYNAPDWRIVKMMGDAQLATFRASEPFVNDYLHFNSAAMGKIYEAQLPICHQGAIGELTPDEFVIRMNEMTMKFQKKFGKVPIREEK